MCEIEGNVVFFNPFYFFNHYVTTTYSASHGGIPLHDAMIIRVEMNISSIFLVKCP